MFERMFKKFKTLPASVVVMKDDEGKPKVGDGKGKKKSSKKKEEKLEFEPLRRGYLDELCG